jgi:hypothetical protein
MTELAPFLTRYLHGDAGIEEIHKDIERWHLYTDAQEPNVCVGLLPEPDPSIYKWLGLLPSEYKMFLENEWKFVRYLHHLKAGNAGT